MKISNQKIAILISLAVMACITYLIATTSGVSTIAIIMVILLSINVFISCIIILTIKTEDDPAESYTAWLALHEYEDSEENHKRWKNETKRQTKSRQKA